MITKQEIKNMTITLDQIDQALLAHIEDGEREFERTNDQVKRAGLLMLGQSLEDIKDHVNGAVQLLRDVKI